MHARLKIPGHVVVDGKDISAAVTAATVVADAGEPTLLSLDLRADYVEVDGEMRPVIPAVLYDALVALGWQPPGFEARGV